MRLLTLIACILFAASAHACETYSSELWDAGVRTATYDGQTLVIDDKARERHDTYDAVSGGTGVPYKVAYNQKDRSDAVAVREYRGDLLVDMEAFTCH